VEQTELPNVSPIQTPSASHNPSKLTTLPQIIATAAEGDNSHVMQASTQQDEDTSHSHKHLKSDTITQPATTESEVVLPALTQPSHIIESEEVIAAPQLNMATLDKNMALPEKVMPETPQPPASSDISTMIQQLLSGQDSQADHNAVPSRGPQSDCCKLHGCSAISQRQAAKLQRESSSVQHKAARVQQQSRSVQQPQQPICLTTKSSESTAQSSFLKKN
jgi:hypothetical protein